MRIAYGYRPGQTQDQSEPKIDVVIEAMETTMRHGDAVFTKVWAVDLMPWCTYRRSSLRAFDLFSLL